MPQNNWSGMVYPQKRTYQTEFNVNAMTGNNRAHQSPFYSPEIQKRPLFLAKPQEKKLPADPYIGPVFF